MLTKLRNERFRGRQAKTARAGDVGLIVKPQLAFAGEVVVPIFHEHPHKLVLCRKRDGLASSQTEKLCVWRRVCGALQNVSAMDGPPYGQFVIVVTPFGVLPYWMFGRRCGDG